MGSSSVGVLSLRSLIPRSELGLCAPLSPQGLEDRKLGDLGWAWEAVPLWPMVMDPADLGDGL